MKTFIVLWQDSFSDESGAYFIKEFTSMKAAENHAIKIAKRQTVHDVIIAGVVGKVQNYPQIIWEGGA